jgi:HPt (histidine-containing phosphotransfer) domain-containing protein
MSLPDAPVLDESVLVELLASVEGDRDFVVDLIEAYLADGVAHLGSVRQAVAAGDAEALVRPAHTLKSSSATVGATALSSTARELEMIGRSGTLDATAGDLAERLDLLWDETSAALRAWMAAGD